MSVTEISNGLFEYELLLSYIENDPKNLELYLEVYEKSRGVKELIREILGRNIDPLVVIMTEKKGERDKRIKVMTVEDDKDTQRMYRMILEKYDINIVSEAFDGREAIEKFRELEEKPGVILLDYNLVTVVRGRT